MPTEDRRVVLAVWFSAPSHRQHLCFGFRRPGTDSICARAPKTKRLALERYGCASSCSLSYARRRQNPRYDYGTHHSEASGATGQRRMTLLKQTYLPRPPSPCDNNYSCEPCVPHALMCAHGRPTVHAISFPCNTSDQLVWARQAKHLALPTACHGPVRQDIPAAALCFRSVT